MLCKEQPTQKNKCPAVIAVIVIAVIVIAVIACAFIAYLCSFRLLQQKGRLVVLTRPFSQPETPFCP